MKIGIRALPVAAAAAGVVLAAGTQAQAAAAPRLVGTWQVRTTITKHTAAPGDVGTTAVRPWVFTPKCTAGSCPTTLKRARTSSQTFVVSTLNPVSATQYRGVARYLSECFNPNGTVRLHDAYHTTETTVVTVTKSAKGVTTAFTGALTITFSPTAAAAAKNCKKDLITAKAASVKRTK